MAFFRRIGERQKCVRILRSSSCVGRRAVISPHIGDLDSPRSIDIFAQVTSDLQNSIASRPAKSPAMSSNYANTRWALAQNSP